MRITQHISLFTTGFKYTDFRLTTKFNKMDKTSNLEQTPALQQTACWAVTGTFHGSIIEADTEGEARRIFHKHYNGESIIHIKRRNIPAWAF
jgi:hypothetical protein